MGRRVGLDYGAVCALLDSHRVTPRLRGRLLSDIRFIEYGALEAQRQQSESSG